MNGLLALASLVVFITIAIFVPGVGASAVLVCLLLAAVAAIVIHSNKLYGKFFLSLFVGALLVRVILGALIFIFNLQEFFGGDALTYDAFGSMLLRSWQGERNPVFQSLMQGYYTGGAWGMLYIVAAVYGAIGRNMLAVQFVNAVIGAATAPVIFLCAQHIFGNVRVARLAALFVAFYPSLVLWSCQGLKDGPIVFFLALIMLSTLRLGERFSIKYSVVLLCAMLAVLSFRFYIFYMVVVAVGGSFVVGMRAVTTNSLVRQFVVVIMLGLAMTYFGVLRTASMQLETFGSLERLQVTRSDQVRTSNKGTGFGKDVDISTTSGALSAIPLGVVYLLFAPFPWQLGSLRQSITMPEMLVWWVSFPMCMLGLWFTLKFHLRKALPILIFTTMLTLSYSIFQGNIGTAYRQRAQVLVFYFIFAAVGFILLKEKREDEKRQALAAIPQPRAQVSQAVRS
jgi:hypothetical protein